MIPFHVFPAFSSWSKSLWLGLFFSLSGILAAQDIQLSGTVMIDSLPAAGVEVLLHPSDASSQTDSSGRFHFEKLEARNYILHILHPDHRLYHQKLNLDQNQNLPPIYLEKNLTQLNEVSVFGSRKPLEPMNNSLSVQVLDREFFDKNGGATFANSIEKIPGISSINTGVGISKPVIRGMSFNRIQVNDRGIKQEGQQWGADHGLEIDPFDVDRVEVVKGPASLIYGSDGMGGVININPPQPPDKTFSGSYTSNYMSNNRLIGNSLGLEGAQGKWVYRLRASHQDFGDYRVPASDFVYGGFRLPIYDERLKNTAGRELHYSLMGGYRNGRNYSTLTYSSFTQEAGIFPGAVGIPRAYGLRHEGEHRQIGLPRQENGHHKLISNTTWHFGEDHIEADLGFQLNQRDERSRPHTHGVGPTPDDDLALRLRLNTYTANIRWHHHINTELKSIAGLQLQYMKNRKGGFEYLIPAYSSFQSGIFYFLKHQTSEKWTLSGGLRADAAYHDISEHRQPIYENLEPTGEHAIRTPEAFRRFGNLSGSLGARYVMSRFWKLKFNAGSSFRMPTPVELGANGVHHGNFRHELGDMSLGPERGYQADMELSYDHQPLRISLSPYFSFHDNYIYLAPSGRFSPLPGAGAFWEYRQDRATFSGGELMLSYSPLRGLMLSLGSEYVQSLNLNTSLPLPLTPPFSNLFHVEYERAFSKGWIRSAYISAEIRHAADQERTDRNERSTDGYWIFQAGAGAKIEKGNFRMNISLQAQNLTDALYFNHLSRYRLLNLPEPGRNILLSLKFPFGKKS